MNHWTIQWMNEIPQIKFIFI